MFRFFSVNQPNLNPPEQSVHPETETLNHTVGTVPVKINLSEKVRDYHVNVQYNTTESNTEKKTNHVNEVRGLFLFTV